MSIESQLESAQGLQEKYDVSFDRPWREVKETLPKETLKSINLMYGGLDQETQRDLSRFFQIAGLGITTLNWNYCQFKADLKKNSLTTRSEE